MNYKILFLTLFCFWLVSCSEKPVSKENTENEKTNEKIIVVKVPPLYDEKLSQVENYWRFQDFLFLEKTLSKDVPQSKIHTPKGLPNDNNLLYISADAQGNIKLNMESKGNISDTQEITEFLKELFRNREEIGVYEAGSQKVVKAIGIQAEKSVKYTDFFNLVEAVKQSGAEPIVLIVGDDGRTLKTPIKNSRTLKAAKN